MELAMLGRSNGFRWAVSASLMLVALPAVAADPFVVAPLTVKQSREYDLPTAYYKKSTEAAGILIASSARVSDHAFQETAYQFDMIMKDLMPAVARRIRDRKVLCLLLAPDELTSELPQFQTKKKGQDLDFYNSRQRGFLADKAGRPTLVMAEEDVLEYEGGRQAESVLVREFGRVIRDAGFDDALQDRLAGAFKGARTRGIWNDGLAAQRYRRVKSKQPVKLLDALVESFPQQPRTLLQKCLDGGDILVNGKRTNSRARVTAKDKILIVFGGPQPCDAIQNRSEYWVEGMQSWFGTNRTMDRGHNRIHTRQGLQQYDPELAKLCAEVLGDSEWRFVSPRQRVGNGHLVGFDPSTAPQRVEKEHLQSTAQDLADEYWHDYWQRLRDKHALLPKLQAEGAENLAIAAREKGDAVRGAVIFPRAELGCTNCHARGSNQLLGPDLTKISQDANDVYLVESLLDPSKVIKEGFAAVTVATNDGQIYTGRVIAEDGQQLVLRDAVKTDQLTTLLKKDLEQVVPSKKSLMPSDLVEQLANRQDFLDLVRYVMQLKETGATAGGAQPPTGGQVVRDELRGLVLLDEYRCLACHKANVSANATPTRQAPDLTQVGSRVDAAYLERFIADPQHVKPGTTMPSVMATLDADERATIAKAITHYLVSLGKPAKSDPQRDPEAPQRGHTLFHSVGCVACHAPRNETGDETPVANSVALGNLHDKYRFQALVAFLKDPHTARPGGRMPNLQLSHWESLDIAEFLLQRQDREKDGFPPLTVDRRLVAQGKQQFRDLGCVQCHAVGQASQAEYPALASQRLQHGCLSGKTGPWPTYTLSDMDRKALGAALQQGAEELTPQDQIHVTLTALRCVACHQRDHLGGVSADRDAYFHTTNLNLGQQGRIPPTLTGVGVKLNPKWLRQVLVEGRSSRPYMLTRMPRYGVQNIQHLMVLLQETDTLPDPGFATFQDQKEMRTVGHELAGSSGLNCVACHTFQQKPAQTMPALDLTEMAERLQKKWFYHYMRQPQLLSRNTVMPTFWPGGRAMRKDVLAGNADMQIEALWQYLRDGRQARTPRGLIREPIELVATDEAVMLRRSYPGIGKRGIGVGYPGLVNLAFDAEQMRLAMIWKGKFAETSGVWRSQGHGTVRPLGDELRRFPAGPELDDANDPWEVDGSRPPRHHFQGYDLDSLRRPMFRYRFENVAVEDYFVDTKDIRTGKTLLRREVTMTASEDRAGVVFRVAVDKRIVAENNEMFVVGEGLRIRIPGPWLGRIVRAGEEQHLQVPLDLDVGKTKLVLEYQW